MKNNLLVTSVVAFVAAIVGGILVAALVGNNQQAPVSPTVGGGTRYPNGLSTDTTSPSAGEVRTTTLTVTGASTLGTSGTAMNGLVAGNCTIWSPSMTIAASTTQQVECQSATDGSLTTTLSGVTADSFCELTPALTSLNAIAGLKLTGYVASSTDAGTITATLANSSASQFKFTSTASSSWSYICVDPS